MSAVSPVALILSVGVVVGPSLAWSWPTIASRAVSIQALPLATEPTHGCGPSVAPDNRIRMRHPHRPPLPIVPEMQEVEAREDGLSIRRGWRLPVFWAIKPRGTAI